MAALGGGAGVVALLVGRTGVDLPLAAAAAMAAAGALNLAALGMLVGSGLATSARLRIGPDVAWLRARSVETGWETRELRLSFLSAAPGYVAFNRRQMTRAVRRRRVGLVLLFAAMTLYSCVVLYIVVAPL